MTKILVSVKFVSAILGPEMGGCANFMDTWKNAFCRKKPMSIKFLVLGGGYFGFLGGGGKCRFYFYGRADFSEFSQEPKAEPEPPEPFFRNRNRNRPSLLNCTETQKNPSLEEPPEPKTGTVRTVTPPNLGDKFGESLGGSQATPSFWEVPGLPRKFPKLPRKFFGDFPGSSLTVELHSNPGVPRKFPRLPRKFPGLPRKFPGLPRRSALSLGSLTPSPDSQKLSLKTATEPNRGHPEIGPS